MPTLLDVTDNANGAAFQVVGPTTIFIEGTLGGGTVTLSAARKSNTTFVTVNTATAAGVVNDTIIGRHFLKASLAGATGPDLTVATL